jgi:hypothetical protein
MFYRLLAAAVAMLCLLASPADARRQHLLNSSQRAGVSTPQFQPSPERLSDQSQWVALGSASMAQSAGALPHRTQYASLSSSAVSYSNPLSFSAAGNYGPRPGRWCGWWLRQQVGQDPGMEFNRARLWAKWGSPAGGPRVGAIVVWQSHVGKITAYSGSGCTARVISGNDNNAVLDREWNVCGAIAFRM